jgi:DNA-binding beta-propeller fold protein YncE
VQIVNIKSGAVIGDVPGQHRNHGVAIVPKRGRGFISDSKDACVYIFDLKTNKILGRVKVDEDADGVQYDASVDKIVVVCGDSGTMYAFSPDVDPQNGSAGEPAKLGGSVEYFAYDQKGKAYVNLNENNQVGVVDLRTMKVLAKWGVGSGGKPVGIAIDDRGERLFVGCRDPQKLVVLSTEGGKVLGEVPIGAGVDATVFDDGLAFASCRDGTLTIAGTDAKGAWVAKQVVTTKVGARTECVDSQTHAIYLPTADFEKGGARPALKAGSFVVLEVAPATR